MHNKEIISKSRFNYCNMFGEEERRGGKEPVKKIIITEVREVYASKYCKNSSVRIWPKAKLISTIISQMSLTRTQAMIYVS